MHYHYILFDLDGTLTNPMEGITGCVQYALAKMERQVPTKQELLPFIGPPLIQSFMEFTHMSEEEAEQAVAYYRERFGTVGLFENDVYPGILAMLSRLKEAGLVLALATSKPEIYAKRIVDKYGITPYLDAIVGSELSGERVVKAEVIEEVFRRLGLEAEEDRAEAVMVGDRRQDMIGAKACGIAGIGVRFGYAEPGELEEAGADFIADTVEDLKMHILSNCQTIK